MPSSHPAFGWGTPDGYVYQKAYVECFASPLNLRRLMHVAEAYPSIMFVASDVAGNQYSKWATDTRAADGHGSGRPNKGATAVTWGVFPDREVQQPTVVDPCAFMAWKAEAFALWRTIWADAYDEDSETRALLYDIHDTYFLVSVVDNDFVGGDIWRLFAEAAPIHSDHFH